MITITLTQLQIDGLKALGAIAFLTAEIILVGYTVKVIVDKLPLKFIKRIF
jgi:hypothetical protein